jgi:hypothetical protein
VARLDRLPRRAVGFAATGIAGRAGRSRVR